MPQDEQDDEPTGPESVTVDLQEFLDIIDNGPLGRSIMEKLREVTTEVRKTDRKGYVQLRLNVEMGNADQVTVEPELKVKEPKHSHAQRIFFADDEGHLYREDPNQQSIPFRNAEGADQQTQDSINRN